MDIVVIIQGIILLVIAIGETILATKLGQYKKQQDERIQCKEKLNELREEVDEKESYLLTLTSKTFEMEDKYHIAESSYNQIILERRKIEEQVNAAIEQKKREAAVADEFTFYRIYLSSSDITDIAYIESILDKVENKQILAKLIWETYIAAPTKDLLNRIVGSSKISGIYKITNIKNGMTYIGQSVDVAKRITEHVKGSLGIASIADQKVHHAMREEGVQNWTFELLLECPKEELNEQERYFIKLYKSNEWGYNGTRGNK